MEKEKKERRKSLTTKWIIKEIAERANFTIGDVKIILDTFAEIIKELIRNQRRFNWQGIFNLSVSKNPSRKKGWDAFRNISLLNIPETYRIVFSASRNLKKLLK